MQQLSAGRGVVLKVEGRLKALEGQLVTLTEQSIVGLDAQTGRELWSAPFSDEWKENIVNTISTRAGT